MKEKDLQVWPDEVPADFPSLEAGGNEDWIEVPPEDMPSDLPDDWALPVGEEFEPDAFFAASGEADGFAPVAEELAPAAAGPAQSGAAEPQTDEDPNGDFKLLDDPLRGRTLIEASAGTGKTYSLEHIVLRLVVERGIAIGRMLVVTFTKAATAELKSRIRGKLIAVRKLVTEGVPPTDKNLFEQFERWKKLELDPDLVRERLDRAVREFDDAVILTIHSFCQKTLSDFVFTSGGSYGVDSGEENDLPEVELFKAGHHGSGTSSNDILLSVIKPKIICVCCCAGSVEYTQNLDNTFPYQSTIERFAKYTDQVYVTTYGTIDQRLNDEGETEYYDTGFYPLHGNIVVTSGSVGEVSVRCSSNDGVLLKDTEWFKENRRTPAEWA